MSAHVNIFVFALNINITVFTCISNCMKYRSLGETEVPYVINVYLLHIVK